MSFVEIALDPSRRTLLMGPFLRIARAKAGFAGPRKSTKPDLSPFFLFLLSSFPSYSQLSFAPIPIENLKFYMKW